MYWYKVKTLLIWMFAVINIFLIIFIVQGRVRREMADKKEIESLVHVLSINSVTVDEEIFSEKVTSVKTAQVENMVPAGDVAAALMLGEGYNIETDENGNTFFSLAGKIVSVSGGRIYYYDGNMAADMTLADEKIPVAAEKLKKYNIDVSSAKGEVWGDKIVFTYYFENLPLFENTLYVKMSGDNICEIGGYIMGIKAWENSETDIAHPKQALMAFLQDGSRKEGEQKIVSLSVGYSALLADTDVNFKITETIPTYKIVTDKNDIYYYDARK